MRAQDGLRTAAQVLVDQLSINGINHVFCVPGESYLAVLDAFYESNMELTVCRQEGGAAMMAEAIGKATGRPGICFVTRGPGATNASLGIHIAQQDSTPIIMFAGQVSREKKGREALQEIDFHSVFGGLAKWVTEIDDAARIPEVVSRAFYTASSGRPGPVVIALPEDMLSERISCHDAPAAEMVDTWPAPSELSKFESLLMRAERPFVIVGGSRWSPDATVSFQRFAERFALPVATSYRRLPLFHPLHASYAGDLGIGPNPKLISRIKESDIVFLVGGRLGELPSQGYTLLDIPQPQMPLVHIYASAEEFGRVYRPHLAIHATPTAFAAAINDLNPPAPVPWRERTDAAHADYLNWTEIPTEQPGGVNLGAVMVWLREHLPDDAILCNGAGNYAAWIHRFYRFRRFGTHIAPLAASMGYGVPAAVAMKRLYRERVVISVNGDGDFLMNGQEFATAVQYDLPIIVIVCDNGSYGTIRMHQEREYPGRVYGTTLVNPDFAVYARAFGGFGATVDKTEDFPEAFKRAEKSMKPAIIHLKIDPEAITPVATLSQIRERAQARTR